MANTVRISSIRTENFPRGNRPLNVGFGTNFAVVRGDNGSGKTTLIKAVAFAALDKDLPIIGLENSTVAVSFRKNGVETTFKRTTKRSISRFSINDGRVQKRTYQSRLHGFIKAEHLKFCLDYNHNILNNAKNIRAKKT